MRIFLAPQDTINTHTGEFKKTSLQGGTIEVRSQETDYPPGFPEKSVSIPSSK